MYENIELSVACWFGMIRSCFYPYTAPQNLPHQQSFTLFPANNIKGKYSVAALMEFTFVASQSSPYFTE